MAPLKFEQFNSKLIKVEETDIFVRYAGSGPAVLFLHGFPQTHLMWRKVAPVLSENFFVVCADLRGYGSSGKPASTPDHSPYSKRAMARDMAQTMNVLGFDRFSLVGHDRGGRVGYRLALDHPHHVERLALLDVVPTGEVFDRADAKFALEFWPWSLLAQPSPLPETLIAAAPEAIVDNALSQWGSDFSTFTPEVKKAYVAALRLPGTIHAICEEYRAGATLDKQHDDLDRRTGRTIRCPVLALWSEGGALDLWYQDAGGPLGILRTWAPGVQGCRIRGGHFFPEQNGEETLEALSKFLSSHIPNEVRSMQGERQ